MKLLQTNETLWIRLHYCVIPCVPIWDGMELVWALSQCSLLPYCGREPSTWVSWQRPSVERRKRNLTINVCNASFGNTTWVKSPLPKQSLLCWRFPNRRLSHLSAPSRQLGECVFNVLVLGVVHQGVAISFVGTLDGHLTVPQRSSELVSSSILRHCDSTMALCYL